VCDNTGRVKEENVMRSWRGVVFGTSLLLAVVGAALVSAQAQQAPQGQPDPFQTLGLSADQKTKVDVLVNERKTALSENHRKMQESRKKLIDLLFDKKSSDGDIDKAADRLARSERDMLLADVKFHKQLRRILSQEQLSTLVKGGK
jgi:Spy/CpxP family protein refolding chaperone